MPSFLVVTKAIKAYDYLLSGLLQKKITDPRIRKRIDNCNKVQEKISRMKHEENL